MGQLSSNSTQDVLISRDQLRARLRSRFSDSEIDTLLNEIQASTSLTFRPGDLITADIMNYVFSKLKELDEKLTALTGSPSSSKQIRIDSFEPKSKVSVGEILIINGANFSSPAILNTVVLTPLGSSILTTPITIPLANYYQTESSPAKIKLQVPVLAGVPGNGLDFLVSVTNAMGDTAQAGYTLTAPATAARARIFRFEPAGQVESGQKLSIIGENFDYPSNLNTLIFQPFGAGATSPVVATNTEFAPYASQSSTSRIVLQVPAINEIPSAGQGFTVKVITLAGGADALDYQLLPPAETTGSPPSISTVTNAQGNTTLKLNEAVTIYGANFGATANDNIVNFVFGKADGTEAKYPVTTMSIAGSGTNMTINLTVPADIAEVPVASAGSVLGSVTLKVDGHPEASKDIRVRR